MVKDLEGKVEVLPVVDHQNDVFGGEALRLGFDWGSDSVEF